MTRDALPLEVVGHITGAAQVGGCEITAAAWSYALSISVVAEVTQELDPHRGGVDRPLPAPAVLLGVRFEPKSFQRTLDYAEVGVRVHVTDQENVDVGRAEVLRDDAGGVACQDSGTRPPRTTRKGASSPISCSSLTSALWARARACGERSCSVKLVSPWARVAGRLLPRGEAGRSAGP